MTDCEEHVKIFSIPLSLLLHKANFLLSLLSGDLSERGENDRQTEGEGVAGDEKI